MKRIKNFKAFAIFTLASVTFLTSCLPPLDPAPEVASLSFTWDGSTSVYYEKGPDGASGTITYLGIAEATSNGTTVTRILASLVTGDITSNFPTQADHIEIIFNGYAIGTYTITAAGGSQFSYQTATDLYYADPSNQITIKITRNDGPGGYLEGTFSGNLTNGSVSKNLSSGSFKVKLITASGI